MGFVQEFRDFAVKGNVMDMAVGVIIGGAFGKIVNSFVTDVMMPPLGLLMGKVDFSSQFMALDGKVYATLAKAKEAGAATLNYGLFINAVIDFTLMALAIFVMIKWINKLKSAPPPPANPPAPTKDQELLTEIRDLLKQK